MTEVRVYKVMSCDCGCASHVQVFLYDPVGKKCVRLRVDGGAGQAILAELNGLSCSHGKAIDLLKATLDGLGANVEALILRRDDDGFSARLCIRGSGGTREVAVEPCNALLAACRMGAPIFVDGVGEAPLETNDVPEVYRPFLETLNLGDLDITEQS